MLEIFKNFHEIYETFKSESFIAHLYRQHQLLPHHKTSVDVIE